MKKGPAEACLDTGAPSDMLLGQVPEQACINAMHCEGRQGSCMIPPDRRGGIAERRRRDKGVGSTLGGRAEP